MIVYGGRCALSIPFVTCKLDLLVIARKCIVALYFEWSTSLLVLMLLL